MEKQYRLIETETKKNFFRTKIEKTTIFIGSGEKCEEIKKRKEKIAKKYGYNYVYSIWPE